MIRCATQPITDSNCHTHKSHSVVLRPAALPLFPEGELKIIAEVAGSSLLKSNGTPDPKKLGSDHLPLFFRLDLTK